MSRLHRYWFAPVFVLVGTLILTAQDRPWMNTSLSPDERAALVVKEMTLDEKISLLHGTGHEGLGITTSLGTARLLTEQLLGRPTSIPAAPYLPARYAKTAQSAEVAVHA